MSPAPGPTERGLRDARSLAGRLASASVLALAFVSAGASAETRCRAVDGDTLRCGAERIRLRGIYAPELAEPGGAEARARLQRRLEEGEIRLDRRGRDRYGTRIEQRDIGPRGGRGIRAARER